MSMLRALFLSLLVLAGAGPVAASDLAHRPTILQESLAV